jgi:hypothetical protein
MTVMAIYLLYFFYHMQIPHTEKMFEMKAMIRSIKRVSGAIFYM